VEENYDVIKRGIGGIKYIELVSKKKIENFFFHEIVTYMDLSFQSLSAAMRFYCDQHNTLRPSTGALVKTNVLKHLQEVMRPVRQQLSLFHFHPRDSIYTAHSLWWCELCFVYQEGCAHRITKVTKVTPNYWINLICFSCWTDTRHRKLHGPPFI
jgi:hypothetical protein